MGLEANVVYLEEEIRNLRERIALIEEFLLAHPSVSIYRREISGRVYYYKKYRKGNQSVSEFLGAAGFDLKKFPGQCRQENAKIKQARRNLAELKKDILALKKQAKIARKALEHARI